MEYNEIAARLKTFFLTDFPNPGVELTDETNLLTGWFVDSIGIVNTTLFLEQSFDIFVRRADINATVFESIATLARYVIQRKQET